MMFAGLLRGAVTAVVAWWRARRQPAAVAVPPVLLLAAPVVRAPLALPAVIRLPPPEPLVSEPVVTTPDPMEPMTKVKAKQVQSGPEGYEFYFREGLLDHLDRYMIHIKRMRQADAASYNLYSKIGAMLLPASNKRWMDDKELSPFWNQTRPGFGAVAWCFEEKGWKTDEDGYRWAAPRFICFRRYTKRPGFMEPINKGDFYLTNVFWDVLSDGVDQRQSWVYQFCTHISPEGEVRPLKMRLMERQIIAHTHSKNGKYGSQRGGSASAVSHAKWTYPDYLLRWAEHHQQTPEEFLRSVFLMTANTYEMLNYNAMRVVATKKNVTAAFGIHMLRAPHFFKDRDVTVTDKGTKRRIFHIVRAHQRGNGAVVKSHFRGERTFKWNGYDVRINVPGLHHVELTEFSVGAVDPDDPEVMKHPERFLESGVLDKAFADNVHGASTQEAFAPLLKKNREKRREEARRGKGEEARV